MRRSAATIASTLVLATLPRIVAADWRDRPVNEPCVQEPCDRVAPDMQDDGGGAWNGHESDQWVDDDPRHHLSRPIDRQFETRSLQGRTGNQPYWGTMHPYWNAPEPPGVIHRGARTRGFHK
jgi:hypothetical protein